MDNGYVLLHRKLFSNKMWLSEKFTKAQAWVDLFANANHKEGGFWVRGNEIKIERGQIGWSIENMAQRWRWNRKTVMRFLSVLEQGHQIGQQRNHLTTIITIINYDMYQSIGTTERTPKGTPRWTPEGTQTKNVKEELKKDTSNPDGLQGKQWNNLIDSFKEINPMYTDFYKNTNERKALEEMNKNWGYDKLLATIQELPKIIGQPFAPKITKPSELRRDIGKLLAFHQQEKNRITIKKPKILI